MPVGLCGELTISARVRGGDGLAQRVHVDREPASVGDQWHGHAVTACHRDDGGVGVVERFDQQHLGARLDQADHGRRDGLGGAHGDQHLGVGVVGDAEVPLALGRDRLAQRLDARPRWVLVDAVGDRVLGGLQHRGGTVLVGKALPQIHRPEAGGQRRHLGEDGHGIRLKAGHRSRAAGDTEISHRMSQ